MGCASSHQASVFDEHERRMKATAGVPWGPATDCHLTIQDLTQGTREGVFGWAQLRCPKCFNTFLDHENEHVKAARVGNNVETPPPNAPAKPDMWS